jgi:hypothetical protein
MRFREQSPANVIRHKENATTNTSDACHTCHTLSHVQVSNVSARFPPSQVSSQVFTPEMQQTPTRRLQRRPRRALREQLADARPIVNRPDRVRE